VAANPEIAKAAILINVDHVARRNLSPARTTSADGYREAAPIAGAVLDVICEPGLERRARFPAFFVSAADKAPLERINP
jgi:hypothetical protein